MQRPLITPVRMVNAYPDHTLIGYSPSMLPLAIWLIILRSGFLSLPFSVSPVEVVDAEGLDNIGTASALSGRWSRSGGMSNDDTVNDAIPTILVANGRRIRIEAMLC